MSLISSLANHKWTVQFFLRILVFILRHFILFLKLSGEFLCNTWKNHTDVAGAEFSDRWYGEEG